MPHILNTDEIKRRADIAAIIGRRVPLTPARGGNHLEGSCPFHKSKSGKSFHVTPDMQSWYCFGCQTGGSVVDFIMQYESLDYPAALELIAAESDVQVEYGKSNGDQEEKPKGPSRQDILAALDAACRYYQAAMTPEARDYLAKRGLGPIVIEKWRIGYARGDSVKAASSEELLLAAGVIRKSEDGSRTYDPLAGRITIPICDAMGRPIAFTARLMGPAENRPKYLNTGDTTVFSKGKTLFGFAQSKPIIKANPNMPCHIVEGQLKAIACIENGIPAVAPGGTAFTPEQAALIHSLTSNIAWCPDPDEAGASAVLKGAPIARHNGLDIIVGTLEIPDSLEVNVKDPDDLMAMGIPVRYQYQSLISWLYERISFRPAANAQEARRVSQEIVPLIQDHPIPAIRIMEMRELAQLSGIPESQLTSPTERSLARKEDAPPPPPPVIDMSMPPERLLYAAILQQGHTFNWQAVIPWIDLTSNQWAALANIGQVIRLAVTTRISIADAINAAAKPGLREYMRYWLHVPEAANADIAALAASVARTNRQQAAMHYANQGNYAYAQYLNNIQ